MQRGRAEGSALRDMALLSAASQRATYAAAPNRSIESRCAIGPQIKKAARMPPRKNDYSISCVNDSKKKRGIKRKVDWLEGRLAGAHENMTAPDATGVLIPQAARASAGASEGEESAHPGGNRCNNRRTVLPRELRNHASGHSADAATYRGWGFSTVGAERFNFSKLANFARTSSAFFEWGAVSKYICSSEMAVG